MSGIDFSQLRSPTNAPTQSNGADREKAQFWLNIGYTASITVGEGKEAVTEERFIALPGGIPVDSLKPVPTNSSNVLYAKQQAARNALLERLQSVCATMQPGDEKFLTTGEGLTIQLRRVNDERPEPDQATNELVAAMPTFG